MRVDPRQQVPQQPGQPRPGQPQPPSDGRVNSYERVVNGKVVKVNAYAKQASPNAGVLSRALKKPGRPRIMAKPGSYSGGRDVPGQSPVVESHRVADDDSEE